MCKKLQTLPKPLENNQQVSIHFQWLTHWIWLNIPSQQKQTSKQKKKQTNWQTKPNQIANQPTK